MQKVSKWAMCAGLSAIALTGLVGCNSGSSNADGGVSPSIQSPVMSKQDDQALAGDAPRGNGAVTSSSTASTGNSAMNNGTTTAKKNAAGGTGGKSAVPAPNTKKQ